MENNWNQLIERYLNGELSAEGKEGFELELSKNEALQQELELHQLTHNLIKRTAIRNLVVKRGKFHHLKKNITTASIVVLVIAAITTAILLTRNTTPATEGDGKPMQQETVDASLLEVMEKELAFENIDPQYFQFTGDNDVFLSESGVLLSITENSFKLDGKPYNGGAVIQWQEAQKASEIVKAGLSTTSGNDLLETQGMFTLNAFTPEGKPLELSTTGVYVQVPVNEQKEGMMLFQGVADKTGKIDWQNPEPMEKLPVPKSMADIDLFPPKYEPKLNELKWFTDKVKRDSLYLSFDERLLLREVNDSTLAIWNSNLTESKNAAPEIENYWNLYPEYIDDKNVELNVEISVPYAMEFGDETKKPLTLEPSSNYIIDGETQISNEKSESIKINGNKHTQYKYNITQKIKRSSELQFNVDATIYHSEVNIGTKMIDEPICWYIEEKNTATTDRVDDSLYKPHIPPSKVLAVWNTKFDNTILATADFEKRMKAIHNTCDERVFDIYAKNLNAPLWQLDQRVVNLGYNEFQKFADERVGKLDVSNEHQQNLSAFYDEAIKTIRKKGRNAALAAINKDRAWDQSLAKERTQEIYRKGLRESSNRQEEFELNYTNVCKQLGYTKSFYITGKNAPKRRPNRKTAPTIVNIDRLVREATTARQSTKFRDAKTGKTAKLTYTPFSVEVENATSYNKLFVYLFSNEINSYQRLDLVNGKLTYNLNGDMNYKAVVVGMNEKGFFLNEIGALKSEDLGTLKLTEVPEQEFDKRINAMNADRTSKPMEIQSEINWLFKEKANYKVQKQRRENEVFRNAVRPTIYVCEDKGETIPEPSDQAEIIGSPMWDESPLFPGGDVAMRDFLSSNLVYPQRALDEGISGSVRLKFTISETGKIRNVTVKKGIPNCVECDAEAKRVFEMMPNWIPAKRDGKNIATNYFVVPVNFRADQ